MEIQATELKCAINVQPNCTSPLQRKLNAEEVRDILCEYVGQHNYSLVKHVERGFVYARDSKNTQEFLEYIMQSIRSHIISQFDIHNDDHASKIENISHVFDVIKQSLKLMPVEVSKHTKDQLTAFIIGNLIKYIV